MNKFVKQAGFLLVSAVLMPTFLFSCSSGSPIDNNDYTISTKFIGCRVLGLQDSYHKNDNISLDIESDTDYKLPEEIGSLEVQDFDGNIVQSRYDYINENEAKVSFKMPSSNVTITCSAISTKKYKINLDFGSDFTFVEKNMEFSPGSNVELHLYPTSFTLGIGVPNKHQCSLPDGFTYRPCNDGLCAVITGVMPDKDVNYTYTGETRPSRTYEFISGRAITSLVATMTSAQVRFNGSGDWSNIDVSYGAMQMSKITKFSNPSGIFGPTNYYEIQISFELAPGNVVIDLPPTIQPEAWEEKLPDFPKKETWVKPELTQSEKTKASLKAPIVGANWPTSYDLDYYVYSCYCN